MRNLDFRGARAAVVGNYFHELWALRHALSLLEPNSPLTALTIEGLRSEDEKGNPSTTWDGVDCALYYGAPSAADCERIAIEQVKYSAAKRNQPWTVARLTENTRKSGNNSVLRRFADIFRALLTARGNSQDGIALRLVSNQPVSDHTDRLFKAINAIKTGRNSGRGKKVRNSGPISKAAGLAGDTLKDFASALDLSTQTGSRFAIEESILKKIAAWADDDANVLLDSLLLFIQRKMLPEAKGERITKESMLAQFGFSDARALFPCPPKLKRIENPVTRSVASEIVRLLASGEKFICLHGTGGCGKTTVLQEVGEKLPAGSAMITFDCYGEGRYLDSDAYRHRPQDAFRQLANDLAVKLKIPLLLTRSKDGDYARSFAQRLTLAADSVRNTDSLLVVAVDAADNSVTAASSTTPPEASFVHDFVKIGGLSENVRFIVSARTGRVDSLNLPARFKRLELSGFTRDETESNLGRIWQSLDKQFVDDFHHLSGGNPRVQSYAIGEGNRDHLKALDMLRPKGKLLSDIFETRLLEAIRKSGVPSTVDGFLSALVTLPQPIPRSELAAISGLTESQVLDACNDLAPAIRLANDTIGFADEDFEDFLRKKSPQQINVWNRIADRFLSRHQSDQYAASHLATALQNAGRGREILSLLKRESSPEAIKDPLLRREIQVQRLKTAVRSAAEANDLSAAIQTILIGAEAFKTDSSLRDLVTENPDLAMAFMPESASKLILRDPDVLQHHGSLLFARFRENATAGNAILAREDFRQIRAWIDRRKEDTEQKKLANPKWYSQDVWNIHDRDIAAQIEAILSLHGVKSALDALAQWRPRDVALRVARLLIPKLIVSGKDAFLEECLNKELVGPPWNLFLLVPLAIAGRKIDREQLLKSLSRLEKYRRVIRPHKTSDEWRDDLAGYWLDTIVSACEIAVALGCKLDAIRPVLSRFMSKDLRDPNHLHATQATLVDLLLRAFALIEITSDRNVTTSSFFGDPETPKTTDKVVTGSERSERERQEEIRDAVTSMVDLYSARAHLLSRKVDIAELDQTLTRAHGAFSNEEWRFRRRIGASALRKKMAFSLLPLAAIPGANIQTLFDRALNFYRENSNPLGSDEPQLASAFMSHSTAAGLTWVIARSEAIAALKVAAQDKISGILNLSRMLLPISRDEAAVLFSKAHGLTGDLDVEAIFKLKGLSALATQAAHVASRADRKLAAVLTSTIATDAAIRLSGRDEFPWKNVSAALTILDLPVALATIARWEDMAIIDRESCLPAVLSASLTRDSISPAIATAFLPLLDSLDQAFLEKISTLLDATGVATHLKQTIVEFIARDELMEFGEGTRTAVPEILGKHVAAEAQPESWFSHLTLAADFLETLKNSQASQVSATPSFTEEAAAIIKRAISPPTVSSISSCLKAVTDSLREAKYYGGSKSIFEKLRSNVELKDRLAYLDALAALPANDARETELAAAITDAISAWPTPAIRRWADRQIPDFLYDHLPQLVRWASFGEATPIRDLISSLSDSTAVVPQVMIKSVAAHVEHMTAGSLYEAVALMADYLEPDVAAKLLSEYLPRCVERLPQDGLDQIDLEDIQENETTGIARYLFALLSDVDVRIRWRAAHVVRRLGALRQHDLLVALLDQYDRTTDKTFREPDAPFYYLAARTWLLIAFDRIASEVPDAAARYGQRLLQIGSDDRLPHVVIRSFAQSAVRHLVASGGLSLSTTEMSQFASINSSIGIKKKIVERYGWTDTHDEHPKRKEDGFHFDPIDTLPYWYEPASRMFADVTRSEFIEEAEKWILDKWNNPAGLNRWEHEKRRARFPEHQWGLWSNDHGSSPTLERYFTYLEWHAMCCTIGSFLAIRPLDLPDYGDVSRFGEWIRSESLSSPPRWLSDLRSPKPLEPNLWKPLMPSEFSNDPTDQEFLYEVGVRAPGDSLLFVESRYTTKSMDWRSEVRVRSALVQPETAGSLMRALQTIEELYRYWLPFDGDGRRENIDKAPYRLLGWLQALENFSGIDKSDPARKEVDASRIIPGQSAIHNLSMDVRPDGRIHWTDSSGQRTFSFFQWSDFSNDNDRSSRTATGSEGNRFAVFIPALRTYLDKLGLDLLVTVQLTRGKVDRYGEFREKEGTEARFERVFIFRRDGAVEVTEGRAGTWHSFGPTTSSSKQ